MTPVFRNEWLILGALLVLLFALIGLAEKLRTALKWHPEVTRKFVHIFTGILIFFTPFLFKSALPLAVLAVFFAIVNLAAIRLNLFKGMHATERPTYGTVYYPLAFLFLLALFWPKHQIIIQLSILILALADALAAIVGENIARPHIFHVTRDKKSIEGSGVMALSSFLIVGFGLYFLAPFYNINLQWEQILFIAISVAITATAAETISVAGSDNISAPLAAAFILHFLLTNSQAQNLQFMIGLILAFASAFLSLQLRFLNMSGAIATFLLGTIVFGIGGWNWGLPILAFFISSSLLSKMWQGRKKISNLLYEKSSNRDYGQVVANGGIPAVAICFFYATGNAQWFQIYLGALAAVTADTWSTEIGALSKTPPRLVTNLQKVIPGTSGAISKIGMFGATIGSLFIAITGWMLQPEIFYKGFVDVLLITSAGVFASLIDSLLGATLQAQYRCPVCQKLTEKKAHCSAATTDFVRGFRCMNNDAVNFLCGLSGFLFVWAFQ